MSRPATQEESAAAAAFLAEWVPGYNLGQWAALAELLASRSERASTPKPCACCYSASEREAAQ